MRLLGLTFLLYYNCKELLTIDNRKCLDVSVAISVRQLEDKVTQQYQEYVSNVFVDRSAKIQDTIKRISFPLPKQSATKNATKTRKKDQVPPKCGTLNRT